MLALTVPYLLAFDAGTGSGSPRKLTNVSSEHSQRSPDESGKNVAAGWNRMNLNRASQTGAAT